VGVVLIVFEISPNNYTGAGVTMIVLGAILAVGAHVLATATREAPDIEDTRAPAMAI
jgi:hypothetical protein